MLSSEQTNDKLWDKGYESEKSEYNLFYFKFNWD